MPDYDSPFFITNDRADIDQEAIEDGTAVVWPLSADAKMTRSPERQYCGNYVTYGDKGAATYRHNADTHDLIAAGPYQHRDMTSSFPLVKTLAKAQARGDRQLLDVQQQDIRVTTSLRNIPAERVTLAKAGMRLQVKGTHWGPTLDTWHYGRIVSAQPRPHSDGSLFDIDLEIVIGTPVEDFVSDGPEAPPFAGSAFAGIQFSYGYPSVPDDLGYFAEGDNPEPGWNQNPTVGPLSVVESSAPFLSILVGANMVARVTAACWWSTVSGAMSVTMDVVSSTRGVLFTDTYSYSGGATFLSGQLVVDEHDVDVSAGEVISIQGSKTGFGPGGWGNSGANLSYLRVGRGTHYWGSGGAAEIWVGP